MRNIALLWPDLLDDLGLKPAVQWLLEDFIRRTGIECSLATDDIDENLSDSVKTCIYRIIQESLHNCEKYAGASKSRSPSGIVPGRSRSKSKTTAAVFRRRTLQCAATVSVLASWACGNAPRVWEVC